MGFALLISIASYQNVRRFLAPVKLFLLASANVPCHRRGMSKIMTQGQKKRGPKPMDENERRGEWLGAAVTKAEKLDFELRAAKAKVHPSLYLRDCCGFARRQGEGGKST